MTGLAGFAPQIIGIVFISMGVASGRFRRTGWLTAPGTTHPWVQGATGTQYVFTTPDGASHEGSSRIRSGLHAGRPVYVLYDPADPRRSVISSPAYDGSLLVAVGIVLVAIGLMLGITLAIVLR